MRSIECRCTLWTWLVWTCTMAIGVEAHYRTRSACIRRPVNRASVRVSEHGTVSTIGSRSASSVYCFRLPVWSASVNYQCELPVLPADCSLPFDVSNVLSCFSFFSELLPSESRNCELPKIPKEWHTVADVGKASYEQRTWRKLECSSRDHVQSVF